MGLMMENHLYFAIYKVLSTFSTFSSLNAMQIPCKHLDATEGIKYFVQIKL